MNSNGGDKYSHSFNSNASGRYNNRDRNYGYKGHSGGYGNYHSGYYGGHHHFNKH